MVQCIEIRKIMDFGPTYPEKRKGFYLAATDGICPWIHIPFYSTLPEHQHKVTISLAVQERIL
jgi:hypothetical protein